MIQRGAFWLGVVVAVLVAALCAGMLWAGVVITRADRAHRSVRAEACRSIEDQALRTLCLVNRP